MRTPDRAQIDFLAPDYTTETATGHEVFKEPPAEAAPSRIIPRFIPIEVQDYAGRAAELCAGVDRLDAKLDAITARIARLLGRP